jgi:2-methylisocitrate lyase-like PEP mutase family enzyme
MRLVTNEPHTGRGATPFGRLHEQGCFVIPNPWDAGTAIALASMGFRALATTSAGAAFARGLPDDLTAVGVDDVLANVAAIVDATPLPVNADFQSGYAEDLEGLATNVRRCVETGVAGLSIEDVHAHGEDPAYALAVATERVRVARAAIDASNPDVLLTGRAECFLYGHPDPLREAITRLQAFADAGADVLYAPGVRSRTDIAALVDALRPHPVNVLMGSDTGLRVRDLAELGVSLGSALTRVAWGAFLRAARDVADTGSFTSLGSAASFDELNQLFTRDH